MMLIPAIDVMNGKVVRLTRGSPQATTSYEGHGSPLDVAMNWRDQGAKFIHFIDLDAALSIGENRDLLKRILTQVDVPIQIGGGIRDTKSARDLLDAGASRIVLGSLALRAPQTASSLCSEYGGERIVVALDHRGGHVLEEGWTRSADVTLEESFRRFTDLGLDWFLITDTTRDGTLGGPDIDTYSKISKRASVIASGGVASLEDLKGLARTGVKGTIVGKALYEGIFTFQEAARVLEASGC